MAVRKMYSVNLDPSRYMGETFGQAEARRAAERTAQGITGRGSEGSQQRLEALLAESGLLGSEVTSLPEEQLRLTDLLNPQLVAPLRENQRQDYLRTLRPSEATTPELAREKFMANAGAPPETFSASEEEYDPARFGGYVTRESRAFYDPESGRYRFVSGVPTAVRIPDRPKSHGLGGVLEKVGPAIMGAGLGLVGGAMSGGLLGLSPGAMGLITGALSGTRSGYTGQAPSGMDVLGTTLASGLSGLKAGVQAGKIASTASKVSKASQIGELAKRTAGTAGQMAAYSKANKDQPLSFSVPFEQVMGIPSSGGALDAMDTGNLAPMYDNLDMALQPRSLPFERGRRRYMPLGGLG